METLPFTEDRFNGVTVDLSKVDLALLDKKTGEQLFIETLSASLKKWRAQGRRGVWIDVPIASSHLIPLCTAMGFSFHRAKSDRLMLNLWLPQEDRRLPEGPFHTVGCGGLVLSEDNEVLVVKERFSTASQWKLPGGYLQEGEELYEGAIREVFEETSVRSEFVAIVAFRHMYPTLHDAGDLYIVILLRPLSKEIVTEQSEIAEAKWLPIEEWVNDEGVKGMNREIARIALEEISTSSSSSLSSSLQSLRKPQPTNRDDVYLLRRTEVDNWMNKSIHSLYTIRK